MIMTGERAAELAREGQLVFGPGCRLWTYYAPAPSQAGSMWFIERVERTPRGNVWHMRVVKTWSA